jgi:hypothetical protein
MELVENRESMVQAFCGIDFSYPDDSGKSDLNLPVNLAKFPNGHTIDITGVKTSLIDDHGVFYASNDISRYGTLTVHHINFQHYAGITRDLPRQVLDRAQSMSRLLYLVGDQLHDNPQ